MKRLAALFLLSAFLALPAFAQDPAPEPAPLSLGAVAARTQVGIGFQREWLSKPGIEGLTPKASWVGVVPASFNVTPSIDLAGSLAYNFSARSTRVTLGVRVVVFGGK